MNINDFKDNIIDLFPSSTWNIDLIEGILILKNKDTNKEFFLREQEFNDIYNNLQKNKSGNNYELFYGNYYEVILIIDSNHYIRDRENDIVEDNINRITYEYGNISDELTLSVILNMNPIKRKYLISRLLLYVSRRSEFVKSNNIIDLFKELVFRCGSLKISTLNATSFERLKSYALSYSYTFMYNRQISVHFYDEVQMGSLLPISYSRNKDFDSPKKFYNPELVSYYSEAISSTILSHQYLSFYHILEYFYEKIFSEDQIKKVREIITDVSFSYKHDKGIVKLIKAIQQKTMDKDVAINEKNALTLLIQKHINQDDLKTRLIERNGDEFLTVLNSKVSFSGGNAIIFSNEESQFVNTLTDRIYKTRNSIVHSKESFAEGNKNNKYKRIKDDKELLQEIALIQVMAEIMINEDSKPI